MRNSGYKTVLLYFPVTQTGSKLSTKKLRKSRQLREKGICIHNFCKPINTPRSRVLIKRMTVQLKRAEMLISINMVGRTEVMLNKTMGTYWGLIAGVN